MPMPPEVRKYLRFCLYTATFSLAALAAIVAYIARTPPGAFTRALASFGASEKFEGQGEAFLVFLMVGALGLFVVASLCWLGTWLSWWARDRLEESKRRGGGPRG